jgi:hypothetical protein
MDGWRRVSHIILTVNVDLERDDGFGFAVNVACDDGIGAGEIQFHAGDRQLVNGSVSFPDKVIGVVVIIRLVKIKQNKKQK